MSHPPTYTVAASADRDDEKPPIFPLTQDVLAPFHSPPPLPPPKNSLEVDVHPDLFPYKEDASACSNQMPTVEAIVINDSPTHGAGDAGWEQYFRWKIKYNGEDVRASKLLFLQYPGKHPEKMCWN